MSSSVFLDISLGTLPSFRVKGGVSGVLLYRVPIRPGGGGRRARRAYGGQ